MLVLLLFITTKNGRSMKVSKKEPYKSKYECFMYVLIKFSMQMFQNTLKLL